MLSSSKWKERKDISPFRQLVQDAQNLTSNDEWCCLFGVTISSIWFFRNKFIFESDMTSPRARRDQVKARFDEIIKDSRSGLLNCAPRITEERLITCCSIMHAELWVIVRGLQIAVANNISSLVVEYDSIAAVNFIKKGHNSSHPCAPLLDDIVVLASRVPYISWSHCLQEANFAANNLAK
ncbi:hypothetical protein AHAS_Ahas02G0197300 [Arachis hypogaea]